jgi:hypothetical protein
MSTEDLLEQIRKGLQDREVANEELHQRTLAAIENSLRHAENRLTGERATAEQGGDERKLKEIDGKLAQLPETRARQEGFEEDRYKAEAAVVARERSALAETERRLAAERNELENHLASDKAAMENRHALETATLDNTSRLPGSESSEKPGRPDLVERAIDRIPDAIRAASVAAWATGIDIPNRLDGVPEQLVQEGTERVKHAYNTAKSFAPLSEQEIDQQAKEHEQRSVQSPENAVWKEVYTGPSPPEKVETEQNRALEDTNREGTDLQKASALDELGGSQGQEIATLVQSQESKRTELEAQQREELERRLREQERERDGRGH